MFVKVSRTGVLRQLLFVQKAARDVAVTKRTPNPLRVFEFRTFRQRVTMLGGGKRILSTALLQRVGVRLSLALGWRYG
jgi:hypothetical protein